MRLTRLLLSLLFVAASGIEKADAQDLKGFWYGGLTSDTSGVYVIDVDYLLNIKEQNGKYVAGLAYVYRSAYAIEGILDFIGERENNQVIITELNILSSKMPIDSKFLCIKNLVLTLSTGAATDNLKGSWSGNIEQGDRCIPGKAVLRRLKPTDYNTVPPAVLNNILTDISPVRFKNVLLGTPKEIKVRSRNVKLEIHDYLKSDNDTVSVFYNRHEFISNLNIDSQPYIKSLRLSRNYDMHEIIMFAENLGHIPPNTSVLTIDDGNTRQSVNIRSSKDFSEVIYLKYEKAP